MCTTLPPTMLTSTGRSWNRSGAVVVNVAGDRFAKGGVLAREPTVRAMRHRDPVTAISLRVPFMCALYQKTWATYS
ncbi:MAG: hypothetical protein HYZ81_24535 [Nitrospinae bacterium]|nr:hypothetical protein [Nitrospinota bacterium]